MISSLESHNRVYEGRVRDLIRRKGSSLKECLDRANDPRRFRKNQKGVPLLYIMAENRCRAALFRARAAQLRAERLSVRVRDKGG